MMEDNHPLREQLMEEIKASNERLRYHIAEQMRVADQLELERLRRVEDVMARHLSCLENEIESGDARLREYIQEQYRQIAAALEAARRETAFSHDASAKAIEKSEISTDKRFDSVNEFRSQLADLISGFLPREVAESQFGQMGERLKTIELWQASNAGAETQQKRSSDRIQPWQLWVAGTMVTLVLTVVVIITNAYIS